MSCESLSTETWHFWSWERQRSGVIKATNSMGTRLILAEICGVCGERIVDSDKERHNLYLFILQSTYFFHHHRSQNQSDIKLALFLVL